jgi:hypothetical protein
MIAVRTSGLEGFDQVDVFVVVAVVLVRQRCRILWVVGSVGVCNLGFLHVQLDDAKATDEVGIDTIYADAAECLVSYDGFGVDIADVDDIALGVYQVNVHVAIDGYQSLGLWAPFDMSDIGV